MQTNRLIQLAALSDSREQAEERKRNMTQWIQRRLTVMLLAGFFSMTSLSLNTVLNAAAGSPPPDFSVTVESVTVEPVTVEPVTVEPVTVEPMTVEPVTVENVVAKLIEHNRHREERLQQASYSAPRTYRIKDEKGNVRVEAQVLMHYRAPGTKEFKIVSKKGSDLVYGKVLKPLMDGEAEAAAGRNRHNSALSPDNYSFNLIGEDAVDGQRCFLLQATPKRVDKYLFRGKIWIHANEFAVVKIAGQPAKSPSVMIKRVDFVRRYQKVGEFWMPIKDESVTQVRFAGTNVLTVDYDNYRLAQLAIKR